MTFFWQRDCLNIFESLHDFVWRGCMIFVFFVCGGRMIFVYLFVEVA